MPAHRLPAWTLAAAALAALTGCLVNSASTKVVDEKARRVSIEFENDDAVRIFTREVRQRYPGAKHQGSSAFAIPFIVAAAETRVLSENGFYNRQVAAADLNTDGVISEAEARAYADDWPRDAD